MPQDSEKEGCEAMGAAYAAIAPQWPGVAGRQHREIGLRAVAAATLYSGTSLPALMRESEARAAALTGPRKSTKSP